LVSPNRSSVPLGRRVLFTDPSGATPRLRLYDLAAGKDVWTRDLPERAVVLDSPTDAGLTAFATPQGAVTVLDARTGREVVRLKAEEERVQNSEAAVLRADGERFYVSFVNRGPQDRGVAGQQEAFAPSLHSETVGGALYAFDRAGARRWVAQVPRQELLT